MEGVGVNTFENCLSPIVSFAVARLRGLIVALIWLLTVPLALPIAVAMGEGSLNDITNPPYEFAFPLAKGDEQLDLKIQIEESGYYMFQLAFIDPYHHSDERTYAVAKVVGDGGYDSRNKKYIDNGRPLKMRLQVDALAQSNGVHLDETITELPSSGLTGRGIGKTGYLRFRLIKGMVLEPGIHRIRLRNMVAAPDLSWIETKVTFSRRAK